MSRQGHRFSVQDVIDAIQNGESDVDVDIDDTDEESDEEPCGVHSHSKERTTFRQWKPSHKQPGHWQETILGSNQHPIQEIVWTPATGCTPRSDWAFTQEDNERPLQALPYWVHQHTLPQV